MTESRIAYRYAKSLLGLAKEQNTIDVLYNDMKLVADTCENSKDLVLLLNSPIVKTDKKLAILQEIFSKKIAETAWAFITIITNKKRENELEGIAKSFVKIVKEHKNIITAEVKSSIKLDAGLKEKILNIITTGDSSKVDLVEKVDENLIGGFILRIGDKQVDASIQRKIQDLKKEFSKNEYIKAL